MPTWLIVVNLLALALFTVAWVMRDPDPYEAAERALDPRRMPAPRQPCGGCGKGAPRPMYESKDALLADAEERKWPVAVFVDDVAVRPGRHPPLRYGTLTSGKLARLG